MNTEQARFNMIEQQIRPWDVLDPNVLQTLSLVKREDFVPPLHHNLAFVDMELPIGHGQFMLQPKVEARLLQDAKLTKQETVLEIGTGTGHLTALLARRSKFVTSLEIQPDLAEIARENLENADVFNAKVLTTDASLPIQKSEALKALGQFDVLVFGGSLAKVPKGLLSLLKHGGRCLAIIGNEPMMCAVRITHNTADNQSNAKTTCHQEQILWDAVIPRLQGFPENNPFVF